MYDRRPHKRDRSCAIILVSAFALLLFSLPALAHDSEPINTNFAAPFAQGSGNLQLTTQFFRGVSSYEVAPVELEYGFAPRQQFSAGLPLQKNAVGSGSYYRIGNLELGYRLLVAGDNRKKFALSLNPALELPSGDKRVAERSWATGGTVNLDTHLINRWWTHSNLGYFTQVARINDREKLIVYNNALMYEAGLRLRPVLEFLGETDIASHLTRFAVAPEAIYAPNHHWEIKAALPLGVTAFTSKVGFQVEVTWKFGEKGRQ